MEKEGFGGSRVEKGMFYMLQGQAKHQKLQKTKLNLAFLVNEAKRHVLGIFQRIVYMQRKKIIVL